MTQRLELTLLPAAAARALPGDRETAARAIGAALADEWPERDVFDVLPLQEEARPFGVWAIVERETATVVGDVGFVGAPDEHGVVELGFSVVPSCRRRGFASEAARELAAWALREPGVRAVRAQCDAGNVASIRTLERAGFVRTRTAEHVIHWRRS